MTNEYSIQWTDNFLGVGYRYFDLRMNVFPIFRDKKQAIQIWEDVIKWWPDPSIKIRFVEENDNYWFVMSADSPFQESNKSFFKVLKKSEHYERFKKGHGGQAYLRMGIYRTNDESPVSLFKKKKIITDIKFLQENEVIEDALSLNCLRQNKSKKT